MATPAPAPLLSHYEVERARKIERNNALLRTLGLMTDQDVADSNDKAWRRTTTSAVCHDELSKERIKKRKVLAEQHRTGTRKSRRLEGRKVEFDAFRGNDTEAICHDEDGDDDDEQDSSERSETLQERRQRLVEKSRKIRQEVALRYSQFTDAEKKAAKENPTATYEHCLMRVRSMTDKGLANRIKAIERAAGKHCVIKMAIFHSCLQHEGMLDLAEAASEALERLKGLLPPVES
jgi:hypothetical protein